jgi:AraC family transcriptional regulator
VARLILGRTFQILPGYASITIPGTDFEYRYNGRVILTWVHFLPGAESPSVPVPVMQDVGGAFDGIRSAAAEIGAFRESRPMRASARLWDILWRLAGRSEDRPPRTMHPVVERAIGVINQGLSGPLKVARLAAELDISHTHLNRLFRQTFGATVKGYVTRRRVELAEYMLKTSDLPIKAIGIQVGILDAQLFNKTVRRSLGVSPRDVRRRAARRGR